MGRFFEVYITRDDCVVYRDKGRLGLYNDWEYLPKPNPKNFDVSFCKFCSLFIMCDMIRNDGKTTEEIEEAKRVKDKLKELSK